MRENPWLHIALDDYERHMRSDSVRQLQALNRITREQLEYRKRRVAILGAAGGNGLEHIDPAETEKVWAVDINPAYLEACRGRFGRLGGILETVPCDLASPGASLPPAELLICNLIVEYLGVDTFAGLVERARPRPHIVACVIQKDPGDGFVSRSALAGRLACLHTIHRGADEGELVRALEAAGYAARLREEHPLPNGKALLRLDFALRGTAGRFGGDTGIPARNGVREGTERAGR